MSEEVITTNVISTTIDIMPSESTLEGGGTVVSTTIDIIPSGDVPETIAEGDNIISVQIDILPEIYDESSESSSGNSGNSGESDSGSSSSDSGYTREDGLEYVRLDDDVSFQILRTNPKLTTNTKLMYDGENLYMEAYLAAPILSTLEYQHHRVWKTGLFNRDIRNFLLGSNAAAFEVGHTVKDTVIMDNFDNQFENMYWCGVESINSDRYPQEMGCIAPLYLRKKRPNYFVIFKITNPSNFNMTSGDARYDFVQDVMSKAKVVKAFDLREGTVLGDYIKRYVEQRDFKYDQSIYVNFSSHEIYYYGIDRKLGVLTQKVENIEDQLLDNDNTIMKADDWITEGFERNNLIFPYIINLEFLFDDKDIDEFCFARYFGMYVNDIDLHDLEVSDCIYSEKYYNTTVTTTNSAENNLITSSDCFYYIKDKKGGIHSVKSTTIPGFFQCPGKLDKDDFTGFESTSTAAYVERIDGVGRAMTIFEIIEDLSQDDTLKIESTVMDVSTQLGRFIADTGLEAGTYYQNRFSCQGTTVDQAKALAAVINACNTDSLQWVGAFSIDDKVVIRSYYPGSHMNRLFKICFPNASSIQRKIRFVSEELKSLETNEIRESYIDGGTDINGCMFKVLTSDRNMFFDESETDRDPVRYFKCGYGRKNAKIISIIPYVTDDNKIDDTYSIVITDENGPYVNVSKTDQAEIIDKFYPKIGVLSMFPVRDFDFDTVTSVYGDYSLMQKEIEDPRFDKADVKLSDKMTYGRFFYHNDVKIDNEYSYYVENVIPELTTINKTVPFIAKWGYMDGGKDSCENPYRLNTSKIFEACNFSANTFMQNGDIMEYTHSMPYYINPKVLSKNDYNEYQYIEKESNSVWGGTYEELVDFFTDKNEDNFDKVFGDVSLVSKYKSKRSNRKYSRFLLGNDINKSTTLFRGVKFEITELDNGKEVKTGKYNDYRFSVIYFPVYEETDMPVRFIKNDTFKFIVGIILFPKENDGFNVFNKAYVYGKNEDLIDVNEKEDDSGTYVDGETTPVNPGDSTAGGGESGSHSGGSDPDSEPYEPVPTHNGENYAGGDSNHYDGDIIYTNGTGEDESSSTVPSVIPVPTPTPTPADDSDSDSDSEEPVPDDNSKYTYDMEDGDLVVYADGRCHLTSEDPSSATTLFEVPEGKTFTLSLDGETYDFDGNESVTITRHPLPGEYKLMINYDDSTDSVKLEINDRLFIPTFKVDEIRIDRSNVQNFARQMESNGNIGRYITNSNLINYELPYINIPAGCKTDMTPEYLYRNIHIKLNDMSERGPYGYEYNGNAVKVSKLEDSNGQWCFVDCTWKKDQTDTLYMMLNGRVYDSMTISTYDSNPDKVCLRGITDSGYNHRFNVNQTYTARDLFGFYPGDTTSFTLNMKSFSISNYDTSALRFTTVGSTPTNWVNFYDNYLRLNVLKSGTYSFYVNWKTTDGIGGKYRITVVGVTDGSGKKQSSSGINN